MTAPEKPGIILVVTVTDAGSSELYKRRRSIVPAAATAINNQREKKECNGSMFAGWRKGGKLL